jgi:hypothetical protein
MRTNLRFVVLDVHKDSISIAVAESGRGPARLLETIAADEEVSIPEAQTEAMRDLERAREDAVQVERVARQQLDKFLLRFGRRWSGTTLYRRGPRPQSQAVRLQIFSRGVAQFYADPA